MPRPLRQSDFSYRYRSMKARGRKWKPWETDTLKQLHGKIPDDKIGAFLKRKTIAVTVRAACLGLKGAK